MARTRGIVLDVAPQPHDEVVDGAGVGVLAQSPDLLQHVFARDGFALVLDQVTQDVGLHQREWIDLAADAHFEQIEMHGFLAEDKVTSVRRLVVEPAEPLGA